MPPFLRDDSGAVTADWVVLTAAAVGLGLAAAVVVGEGVGLLGTDIGASLSNASVVSLGASGESAGWRNAGITNGLCPGRAALETSYNALVAAGETFEDYVSGGASGPMAQTWFGTWLDEAETQGFSADEFVVSHGWWQNNTDPALNDVLQFQNQVFACTLEASPTDWSTMPGGSFEAYLMADFGFQLPPG